MGIGSFLFGDQGGIPKDVKKLLYGAYGKYAGEDVPQDELDFIRRSVEPTFRRARSGIASQYAGSDAPIVSGGRTLANIDLAGEEAGAIGGMTQEAKQRRRQLAQQYLQLLMQGTNKAPTTGAFGSIASGFGAFAGSGALGGGGNKPSPGQLSWGTGTAFPV